MHESDLGHGISSQRNLVLRKQLAGRRRSANGVQLFLDICTAPWSFGQGAVAFGPCASPAGSGGAVVGQAPPKDNRGPAGRSRRAREFRKGTGVVRHCCRLRPRATRASMACKPSVRDARGASPRDPSSQWSSGSFPQRQRADRIARCPDVRENLARPWPRSIGGRPVRPIFRA